MEPILKWAGGKRQLLKELLPLLDPANRYIEPFLGGAAVLFALNPSQAAANDSNAELIGTYRAVRDHPEEVFEAMREHRNDKEYFLQLRATQPATLTEIGAAARMIFLNKTCFNGLYRVNKKNEFNVPFGNYKKPSLPTLDTLCRASAVLQGVTLESRDFESFALEHARQGDQVYLDPPYIPVSEYSDFTRYTPAQFRDADQIRVAELATTLVERGCLVVVSNSDHPRVRELYEGFEAREVQVRRAINRDPAKRRGTELILVGGR